MKSWEELRNELASYINQFEASLDPRMLGQHIQQCFESEESMLVNAKLSVLASCLSEHLVTFSWPSHSSFSDFF